MAKAKSNSVVSTTYNPDGTITYTVKGCEPFTFNPTKASAACRAHAEMHGWDQRISDGAALSRDPKTGLAATPEAKRARMIRLRDHYESGATEWRIVAAARGPKVLDVGLVVMALMRAFEIELDAANGRIDKLAAKREITREEAARVWSETPQVAGAMAAIEAERAPIGADDLLAEIEGMDEEEDGDGDEEGESNEE